MLNRSMGVLSLYLLPLVAITSLLTLLPEYAFAAPDAGDILRQQPTPPVVAPVQKPQIKAVAPAEADKDTGPKILVKGFLIQGALLIPEAELVAQLKDTVGKELSFRQLEGAASALTAYYFQKGYLARVILPEQDIKNGIVTLQVIEGKRGELRINSSGERIDTARVGRFVDRRVSQGNPMSITDLGEAINILNKQPGISATTSLAPGKIEGDIDVTVNASDKPLTTPFLGADNRGSYSTGEYQVIGGLFLSNPTGHFDRLSVIASASSGNTYGRMDYSIAVGDAGLRVGANFSGLRYRLTHPNFSALQSKGAADTFGLTFSYPLVSLTEFNLGLTGSYDDKRLVDDTVAGEAGNRIVTVGNLGLSGYMSGDSMVSFGTSLSFGKSNQRNADALLIDSLTRQTQGSFSKVSYNAGYLYPIASNWSFNAALRGQAASKNLDSTERFGLGGPSAVRGYPVGEASGDDGWLLVLTVSNSLTSKLAANVFLDTGRVRLNHNTWANWNASNTNLPNTYQLSGVGVGLDFRVSPEIVLNASIAKPIGTNPGRDVNGMNSDGKDNHARAWFGLASQF